MTSDGDPPQYPPPTAPGQFPGQPPTAPGQFPGQPPAAPGQFPGQQFGLSSGGQQWAPAPGYQPPPLRDLGGSSRPPGPRRGRVFLGSFGVIVLVLVIAGVIGAVTRSNDNTSATITVPSFSLSIPPLAPTSPTTAGASKPATSSGHVGSTVTLDGQTSGEKVDVTLVKVAPTTTSTDGFSTPPAGDRYFAAEFRLTNSGSVVYSDSADNDAVALDAGGQQYQTDIVGSVAAGAPFTDPLTIAPGSVASGWIVFDVPRATTITSIQFTTDSGFGDTGRWTVP